MVDAQCLTTVGIAWVIDAIDGTVSTKSEYVAWGTGADTASVDDTTVSSESGDEARAQGTLTQPAADTSRCVATLTCATNPKTITNGGVFTALTVGTCVIRFSHTGIALAVGDSIQYTINLQQT